MTRVTVRQGGQEISGKQELMELLGREFVGRVKLRAAREEKARLQARYNLLNHVAHEVVSRQNEAISQLQQELAAERAATAARKPRQRWLLRIAAGLLAIVGIGI